MQAKTILPYIFFALLLSSIVTPYSISSYTPLQEKPLVVTTTSVLASIVKDLAKDLVEVRYLVSPSMCPGHYDVKPGDIETIRSADLILAHGMEWSRWLRELINSANQTGDLKIPVYNITGAWNSPPLLKQRYTTIAQVLENTLGLDLSDRLNTCLESIDQTAQKLMDIANEEGFNDTPVVVMQWLVDYIEFLGFDIVAKYGPPEFLSTSDIIEIEQNATEYKAKLIIDNLHSGVDVGAKIAEDVGAVHVVLINFPEAIPGIGNVTQMMLYNARVLADGLIEYSMIEHINNLREEKEIWQYSTIGLLILLIIETLGLFMVIKRGSRVS